MPLYAPCSLCSPVVNATRAAGKRGAGLRSPPGSAAATVRRINWHATRRAFFRFFVALLLDYRDYLVYGPTSMLTNEQFNKTAFIESCKKEARPFVTEFINSQVRATVYARTDTHARTHSPLLHATTFRTPARCSSRRKNLHTHALEAIHDAAVRDIHR